MNEFFREVDDDYRRDRLAQIWRRYSVLIVTLAVLLTLGIAGWRYRQSYERGQAEAAASAFDDALLLDRDGKTAESAQAFQALEKQAPSGYRLLAQFRAAAEAGKQESEAGAKAFDALAADATLDGTMQDLARLRAALLRFDGAEAGWRPDLERLAAAGNPWRHTARELLGVFALKQGDSDQAGRWFDQIAADRETPQALRARLDIYAALVSGGAVKTP